MSLDAPASAPAAAGPTGHGGVAWAAFVVRIHLGLLFLLPGLWRVFDLGPIEHARRFFVEPYTDSLLPTWSLWLAGTLVPFVELSCGALLLVGHWRRRVLVVLGLELAMITFGHLLAEPLWAMHSHVLPRLILVSFLLVIPPDRDRWALDLGTREDD